MKPVRVLHVFGRLNMGGAETRVMDLYRHMDREKVQFDFLVHYRRTDEDRAAGVGTDSDALLAARPKEDFDEEARSLGAHIYVLPRFTGTNLSEYKKAAHAFFVMHHDWAVIEGHMTSMASVYLPIAKEEAAKAAGSSGKDGGAEGAPDAVVPVTIAHARSAGVDAGIRGLATRMFRRSLPRRCDIMMSCSGPAAVSVFGEKAAKSGKVMMIPNALDLDAFRFDPSLRRSMREAYGISEDTLVIGHVGRFDAVKNQAFLAKVGAGLAASRGQSACAAFLFLFIGKGDLQPQVRDEFEKEGLGGNVVFAGQQAREQTAALYQAFDVFVLPSLYEGLPGTVIEAQAAGLPCVIADTITQEVAATDLVQRISLEDTEGWTRSIAKHVPGETDRAFASSDARRKLAEAGYEVRSAAGRMQGIYLELAQTKDPEAVRGM